MLPSKSEFVSSILSKYGNKTHMTHGKFEALVKILKLGTSVSSTVSTDVHNHRKKRSVEEEIFSRGRRATTSLLHKVSNMVLFI